MNHCRECSDPIDTDLKLCADCSADRIVELNEEIDKLRAYIRRKWKQDKLETDSIIAKYLNVPSQNPNFGAP